MKLFSYVVARDFGFAPNPFHGWCTLATCKPKIRGSASIGDWVVGTGAKGKYGLVGRLMYAMRVMDKLGFDAYWNDPRFVCKRPVLNGSLKQIYGDNIYHRVRHRWKQEDSHHSYGVGRPNRHNLERDTSVDGVLISRRFVYYGAIAPEIPRKFRLFKATGEDICCPGVGHRVLSSNLAGAFENWLEESGRWGIQGMPIEFGRHKRSSSDARTTGRRAR